MTSGPTQSEASSDVDQVEVTGGPQSGRTSPLRIVGGLVSLPAFGLAAYWLLIWMRSTTTNRLVVVAVALAAGVVGVFALFWVLDKTADAFGKDYQESIRPWVYVGPALVLLTVFLVYPAISVVITSLHGPRGDEFVGIANYSFIFSDPATLRAIRNTLAWMIVVPALSVSIGLIFAVLADRLNRGESIAKSLIFLPMAVSFVGASVVFGFIYDFRVFGSQTGLLNGIWTALGNEPVNFLAASPWNNLFLMLVMVWMQTGFAMVILSAAIKGVPEDIIEAGRIDGATELQIFRRIIIPSVMSAIVVVTTTMVINVMKIFDIVFVMTNGEFGTEVIAQQLIRWSFTFRDFGTGASIAVLLFVMVIPVMVWNVRRFRAEEEIR